jgi:hypothetical protein
MNANLNVHITAENFTGINYKTSTNFGHDFHITKQEKEVVINMCQAAFSLWVIAEIVVTH